MCALAMTQAGAPGKGRRAIVIGKLTGKVDGQGPDWVLIDVGGVGYQVHCASRTLARLPEPGGIVALSIETVVREDMIRLYGFGSPAERDWFRLLQSVQGVGAKAALAILGVLDAEQLALAIAAKDAKAVAKAPGVGPKIAQRICAELKDKGPAPAFMPAVAAGIGTEKPSGEPQKAQDAASALVNLGYGESEAYRVARAAQAEAGPDADVQALIRIGLKLLSST